MPQEVTAELIAPLAGVNIPKKTSFPEIESFAKAMIALWRLTECRKRLDTNNKYERDWLAALETEELSTSNDAIKNLNAVEYQEYEGLIEEIGQGQLLPSSDEFALLLNHYVQEKVSDMQARQAHPN